MSLTASDEAAVDQLAGASSGALREAAARMPKYQRTALHWLARELGLLARAPEPTVPGGIQEEGAPEHERIAVLGRAALERSRLSRQISECGGTTEQRAFMQQTLAHLWARVQEAYPICRRR